MAAQARSSCVLRLLSTSVHVYHTDQKCGGRMKCFLQLCWSIKYSSTPGEAFLVLTPPPPRTPFEMFKYDNFILRFH